MVVDNFDVFGAAIFPDKANAPLIVDADRMLPATVTLECLKAVTRRPAKIVEGVGIGNHRELSDRDPDEIRRKAPRRLSARDIFGSAISVRSDHGLCAR